ncbi:MAG: hypothetical protein HKP44_01630 [Desulfofustis sp.]|nr:hypothetical protein [Desulfofustis sp.]
MKSYNKELTLEVPTRRAFINITSQVESSLRESVVQEGLVLVDIKQNQSIDYVPFRIATYISRTFRDYAALSSLTAQGISIDFFKAAQRSKQGKP